MTINFPRERIQEFAQQVQDRLESRQWVAHWADISERNDQRPFDWNPSARSMLNDSQLQLEASTQNISSYALTHLVHVRTPLNEMPTHDIPFGRQRRVIGEHIKRPFAKCLPDNHKTRIFATISWLQVENTVSWYNEHGWDDRFERAGASYVKYWNLQWQHDNEED